GFHGAAAAQAVFLCAGTILLITSFTTRYEPGFLSIIPMPLNLTLDAFIGLVLAASPWIFGFSQLVQLPHVFLGGILILISLFTKKGSRFQRSFSYYAW
ncbi:MAG TPA: SPW repeat protein, partial [Sphingobacteriaceae bacterium]